MWLENKYSIDTYDAYFSVIKGQKALYLYHRFGAKGKRFKTKIRAYFPNKYREHIILTDPCLAHNFSIPPGFDFAIGGLDYSVFKHAEYNGHLYLLKSDNPKEWKVERKLDIDCSMPRFIKAINPPRVVSNFDSMTSLIENNGKYFLYTRANVYVDIRHLQYFESSDLINWDANGKVKFDIPVSDTEFYYSPYFFKHPIKDIYIGWLTYVDTVTRYHCLKIFTSKDCHHWEYQKDFFDDRLSYYTRRKEPNVPENLKPYYFPVYGYWIEDNRFHFMIQRNYLGLKKDDNTEVIHYSMTMEKLNELCNL